MKCKNKAIYMSATLGLGVFAPLLALRSCPRTQPSDQVVSIYFYISLLETSLVSRFLPLIVVKPPRKFKKSLKPAQKKARFLFQTLLQLFWLKFQLHIAPQVYHMPSRSRKEPFPEVKLRKTYKWHCASFLSRISKIAFHYFAYLSLSGQFSKKYLYVCSVSERILRRRSSQRSFRNQFTSYVLQSISHFA